MLRVTILPWSSDVAEMYARLRGDRECNGARLDSMDMLMAAHSGAMGTLSPPATAPSQLDIPPCLKTEDSSEAQALAPALQARLKNVAGKGKTLVASPNHSAFNSSNALGAAQGGMSIAAGFGWASTGLVATALAIIGLALMLLALWLDKKVSQLSEEKVLHSVRSTVTE